jgi:predicted outer membrane repeat protein
MLQRKLARSLAGAALLLALGQGVAQAGTINVTAKTPPGVNPDGKCSFIEAIVNANHGYDYYSDCSGATIGPNTITLPKGTQSLTVVDNSTYGATGLPVIASSITIQGNSSKIIRSSSAPSFRVFAVGVYSYLTLQNVTVSGGSTGGNGGAILNYGYTTISGSTISKNTATRGGAIFNAAAYPGTPGTLVINDSIITGNLASVDGGGLNSAGYYADVAINSSTFSKNSAGRDGGGIAAFDGGYLLIRDSTISGNKAVRDGGGVFHYGYTTGFFNLVIDNSILSKNSSMYGGGVCDIFGNFHLYNSTIASNKATVSGGGVLHYNSLTPYNFTGNVFLKNKAPYFPNISFTF